MPVHSFRELIVWQKSQDLAVVVYHLSSQFPDSERFGLTQQLRRAVVSVSSNLAEGAARESTADFLRFLAIARGSLAEVQSQIILSQRLGFVFENQIDSPLGLCDEVSRLLSGLINSLRKRDLTP